MGNGRLRRGASRLIADILESLDEDRPGGMVKAALRQRLQALNIAPLLGHALEAAMKDGRHLPLLDGIVKWAAKKIGRASGRERVCQCVSSSLVAVSLNTKNQH